MMMYCNSHRVSYLHQEGCVFCTQEALSRSASNSTVGNITFIEGHLDINAINGGHGLGARQVIPKWYTEALGKAQEEAQKEMSDDSVGHILDGALIKLITKQNELLEQFIETWVVVNLKPGEGINAARAILNNMCICTQMVGTTQKFWLEFKPLKSDKAEEK